MGAKFLPTDNICAIKAYIELIIHLFLLILFIKHYARLVFYNSSLALNETATELISILLLNINLCLIFDNEPENKLEDLKDWNHVTKTPAHGEGLADKGYEKFNRFFSKFNRVRCPRI